MTRVDLFLARIRSIGTPLYQEFPPPRDLSPFVACTWLRLVRDASGSVRDAILPDGCADIMVYDDEPPRIAGPDAVTRWVDLRDGLAICGIRLRPGACRAVFGCRADEILNGSILLTDIANDAIELHRALMLSDSIAARLALLETWVRSALGRAPDNDRAVIAACRMLAANPTIEIGHVADQFDWNVRTIHRRFVAACGYSPKHFQRIMRIQNVLQSAAARPSARLGELAAAAGYADQAHMTRDFRDITGFTPASYLADPAASGWGAWLNEAW
jgi:AraC-like DNA-binding protein